MLTALVGLFGIVLGAVITGAIKLWMERQQRHERIRDIQTALRAEIRSNRARLAGLDWDGHANAIARRIRNGGNTYTPFVPHEPQAMIFDSLLGHIHILPGRVIDPVVLYYRQIASVARFAEDLRSEKYAALDAGRKVDMYKDYLDMSKYAVELAEAAIAALSSALEQGADQ